MKNTKPQITNYKQIRIFEILISVFFVICCLGFGTYAHAAPTDYTLLAPIPLNGSEGGVTPTVNTATYLPGLVQLIIALAGVLAVVMIIFGGIKYISTEAWGGKSDAKDTITNALVGLLLVISSWLILNTVNPNLVKINLNIPTQAIAPVTPPSSPPLSGGGGCTNCVTLTGVDVKPPMRSPTECGVEGGCGCAYPGPCRVAPEMNARLNALRSRESSLYVTEAAPPTVHHEEPCHNDGTCVDAKIRVDRALSAQEVKRFLDNTTAVNLGRSIFEAASSERLNELVRGGVDASRIIVTSGNGEHFHIRLQ